MAEPGLLPLPSCPDSFQNWLIFDVMTLDTGYGIAMKCDFVVGQNHIKSWFTACNF
jgi:hypothetical protein